MKKILYIKRCFVLCVAVFLVFCTSLFATGYAGRDKNVCAGSGVQIGSDPVPGACYNWTPAATLNNPHAANPIATPTTTTRYTVTVVGPNFSFTETDYMTVYVQSEIWSIYCEPLICCWKVGDPITLDQFKVGTTPSGMEKELYDITITPPVAPTYVGGSTNTTDVTITAKSHCGEDTAKVYSTTCSITVVKEDFEISQTTGFSGIDFDALTDACDWLMGTLKKFPGPCGPTTGAQATTISGSTTTYSLCCTKPACVKPGKKYTGSLSYSPSVACNFPFLGIPYVASINIYITAGVSASVNLDGFATTCEGTKHCISVGVSANAGGGLSATVLGGSVLNASLALVATIDGPAFQYCFPVNEWELTGKPCIRVDVVGSVTLFTFITESASVTLIRKTCFFD